MLGKGSYPILAHFVNALWRYDMREEDNEKNQVDQFMAFQDQKMQASFGRCGGNYFKQRGQAWERGQFQPKSTTISKVDIYFPK